MIIADWSKQDAKSVQSLVHTGRESKRYHKWLLVGKHSGATFLYAYPQQRFKVTRST